ncbi:MAG: radical SAM protein [Deltaproteobacteria bacterium]|nr:radical SAM protein [Deltaproteobacteria bacterium]
MKKDAEWPMRRIQLETVNICNYLCPLCETHNKDWVPRRAITLEEAKSIIQPAADSLLGAVLYGTRGEPFLNKQLEEIVAYLKKKTRARVSISTNGSVANRNRAAGLLDAGLDQIIFAIDGITQETYEKYRQGGGLDKVIRNLEQFCSLKHQGGYRTRIVFQFIPMGGNEHEIPDLPAFGYGLGADIVRLKFSTSVSRSTAFRVENTSYPASAASKEKFLCPMGLDVLYIDPNGYAYPCCYAEGNQNLMIGNALKEDVNRIWNSPTMRDIKRSFSEQSGFIDFCVTTCRNVNRLRKRKLPRPDNS